MGVGVGVGGAEALKEYASRYRIVAKEIEAVKDEIARLEAISSEQ